MVEKLVLILKNWKNKQINRKTICWVSFKQTLRQSVGFVFMVSSFFEKQTQRKKSVGFVLLSSSTPESHFLTLLCPLLPPCGKPPPLRPTPATSNNLQCKGNHLFCQYLDYFDLTSQVSAHNHAILECKRIKHTQKWIFAH